MSIEESIKDLYIKQNLSRKEVCLKLNITCARLKYIIYKNNLQKLKPKCYIKDVLEKYSIEEIKKYFYSHSSVDTAKYFNMSLDNLKMLMKKFNFHHSVEQKVKIREATCEKMYGVRCVFQRPDVREKCESEESIQKMHQTQIKNNLEKYGCKYVVQRNDVREKIKQTNMRKYGGNGWTCSAEGKKRMSKIHLSKEIQDKTNNTKKLNHSFNSSKIEERCKKELISKYGEDNVLCQYRDNRYPFNCDFYIKSLDLFIEVNYHWTHGKHPFDINNATDVKILNEWKEKAKTSKFYKNAIETWTKRDVDKLNTAKTSRLNFLILYPKNLSVKES